MDLSLVPISDLITEITKRCGYYIIGYSRRDKGDDVFDTHWNGNYLKTLGLCSTIAGDIQNHIKEEN